MADVEFVVRQQRLRVDRLLALGGGERMCTEILGRRFGGSVDVGQAKAGAPL